MRRDSQRIAALACAAFAALAAAGALPSAAAEMDYATFAQQIRERGVTRVEDALALLPAEMRLHYTLVHQSRSIQQGSLQNPRVLLFGTDARLIVTFNGNPDETNYDKLEILAFDDASETFALHSIEFGTGPPSFADNPAVCTACHRAAPQPIWKDYGSPNEESGHGQWPGSYGANHDLVSAELRPALLGFWAAAPQHPRYRYLLRDPESDLFPYQPSQEPPLWQHRFRPNDRLSRLLARLQARRVARALRENAVFREHPNLVLSWFLECDEWQADPAFPAELRRLFAERFPEARNAALWADLRSVQPEDRYVVPFLIEKLFTGLDVYQWNMSVVTPSANRYHEGIQTIDELVAGRLLEHLAAEDPALAPYYRSVTFAQAFGAPAYFQPGGAIWSGDIGQLYDRGGLYHDLARAKQACEIVVPRARAEIGAPVATGHAAADARPPRSNAETR